MESQEKTRVICFYDPNIEKEEALSRVWSLYDKDIVNKVVFEGSANTEFFEEQIISKYSNTISQYWALFENGNFRKSSY